MLDVAPELANLARLRSRFDVELGSPIVAIATSPLGTAIAVALADGPVVMLDAADGRIRWRTPGHFGGTLAVAWNGNGSLLATSGLDGRAHIYAVDDGSCTADIDAGARWATRVAFEPGARSRLLTAAGKRLRLWSSEGEALADWPERSSTILDIAWRPVEAGPPLVATTSYGGVGLYDPMRVGRSARELTWRGSSLLLAWSPNAKYLATGDQDRSVHFWIVRSGRDLQMNGYPRKVCELTWHHSSRFLATGGGHCPCIWDCAGRGPAGTTPQQLEFHEEPVSALAYQHRGELLASAALDGTVAFWEPRAGGEPVGIGAFGDEIVALAWTSTDDVAIAATLAGRIVGLEAP